MTFEQRLNQTADRLSTIFHPGVVGVITAVIITYLSGDVATLSQALLWSLASLILFFGPPFLFVWGKVRRGAYRDMDVSVRENRTSMFLFTIFWFVVMLVSYHFIAAPRILIAFFGTCLLFVLAAAVINYCFTKVSLHSLGLAAFVTMFFFYSPLLGITLALITLLVGWARVQLQQHTISQVLIGWIVAASCTTLVFMFYL